MIRFVYNLLWPVGLLVFLPGYLVKMFRRGGYRRKFGQRLAIYGKEVRARLAKAHPIWLHAVSVGEASIALKLAVRLHALRSDQLVVLTTTTTTGFAFANANAPEWIEVMYAPLDFWPIMRRAFAVIKPERVVLVEAEVWPNLMATTRRNRVPVALVNARLSPRSERRFRRFNVFVRPMFRLLDLICVQNHRDGQRWNDLGVVKERIECTGSVKYDPEDVQIDARLPQEILARVGIDRSRPVLLGGSTHHGEEETLAKVFQGLRSAIPDLFLVIAPRHVERCAGVVAALQKLGLNVAARSDPIAPSGSIDCLVIDTTGELRHWYAIGTVIFVGKSLIARGGQNPAEAIIAGKPVVFGMHMENFVGFADELVSRNGAIQVDSPDQLATVLGRLLSTSTERSRLVENARQVLAEHSHATQRTAELVVNLTKR